MQGYYVNTSDHAAHTHSDMHRMHGMPNEMHAAVPQMPVEMMHNMPAQQAPQMQHMQQMQPMQPLNPVSQPAHTSMYNMDSLNVNFRDIMKRAIKYLLEGLAVAFVAHYFTKGKLDAKEVIMLGITAAFVFAILDTFSPTISLGARFGAGFGVGQTMFGLNPMMAAAAPVMM